MKRIVVLAALASALLTTQGSKASDGLNVATFTAVPASASCDPSNCPQPCPPCPLPCAEDELAPVACAIP